MKGYSLVHLPLMSFCSKDLYRDAALKWRGVGLGYLFLLLAMVWIPLMIIFQTVFLNFSKFEAPAIIRQIPGIAILKGNVSVEGDQPCYIRHPSSGTEIGIIDTTGQIQTLDNTKAVILLTKNKLIVRKSEFETTTMDLAPIEKVEIDQYKLEELLDVARMYLVLILYPAGLIMAFIYRVVQVLIYALIGLMLASSFRVTLRYSAMMRVAVVAITPAIVIDLVMVVFGVSIPSAGLVYMLISLGYLYFGVKVVAAAMQSELQPATATQQPPSSAPPT